MDFFKHFNNGTENQLNESKKKKEPVLEELDEDPEEEAIEDEEDFDDEYTGEGEVYELRGLNEEEVLAIHKALNLNESENLSEATKWVVRDGKKKKVIVKIKKKHTLSMAQKRALKLAQSKAHTASANRNRKKSMKIANKLNEAENLDENLYIEKLVEAYGNKPKHVTLLEKQDYTGLKAMLLGN